MASSSPKAQRTALVCNVDDATCGGSAAGLLEPPAAARCAVSTPPGGAQRAPASPSALWRERDGEAPLEILLDPSARPPLPLFGPPAADGLGDEDSDDDAVVARAFADFGRMLCADVALRAGGVVEASAPQCASHAAVAGERACARRAAPPPTVDARALPLAQRPAAQPKAPAGGPFYHGVIMLQRKTSCHFRATLRGKYIVTCDTAEAAARAYDDAARAAGTLAVNFPRPGTHEIQAQP